MQSFIARLIPFIFFGFMIVLLIAGMIILSYLLIAGALIGLVLFGVAWIRERFFNKKSSLQISKRKQGRTFDHHDV